MKKVLIALLLVSGISTATFAQQRGGADTDRSPEARAARQTERLAEELKLDTKQRERVYNLNLARAKEMEAFRNEGDKARTDARQTMQKHQQAYNDEMKKILSSDQFSSFEKRQDEMKDRMKDRRGRKNEQSGHEKKRDKAKV